jgi:hypothetical protein
VASSTKTGYGRSYPYTDVRFSSAPGSDPKPAPDSRRSTVRTDPFQTFSSTGAAAVHLQARDMEVGNPGDAGFPTATRRSTPYTSGKIRRDARIPIRQLRRRRWSARWSRRAAPAELGAA